MSEQKTSRSGGGEDDRTILAETQFVVIKRSRIHGLGGFARAEIAAGARLLEYVGERITKHESLRRCEGNNEYIFALDEEHDLDGNVEGNPARFLNHSCAPNCEARLEEGRVWVVAIRRIRTGEEVTFNYGYDLEDYRDHPCQCGSADCVGYIVGEEFLEQVRGRQQIRPQGREGGA